MRRHGRDLLVICFGRLLALGCVSLCVLGTELANAEGYGKPGDPINLVVGYQPYGTENLDATVMRAKETWKKYLPPGSTVQMQVALQGSIIVNNMLAINNRSGSWATCPRSQRPQKTTSATFA